MLDQTGPEDTIVDPCIAPFTVVLDSNEVAHGTAWDFRGLRTDAKQGRVPLIVPTVVGNLPWGDYSIQGLEEEVAIERKRLPDLFQTLSHGRQRFERELEALQGYQLARVVVEASWPDIYLRPPSGMLPKSVHRSVIAYQQRYPRVVWDFLGLRQLAQGHSYRVLERFVKDRLDPGLCRD
jgi:ERCC4-type nuclease